jgi:hypothetical protein
VSAVAGPTGPFWAGAAVFLVGAVVVALRVRTRAVPPELVAEPKAPGSLP